MIFIKGEFFIILLTIFFELFYLFQKVFNEKRLSFAYFLMILCLKVVPSLRTMFRK
ncbi:Uncharacterised protein [Chryseobacterium nakagawai]|nr:Uncharacterised protein [Chryseobacterium nakagawai]